MMLFDSVDGLSLQGEGHLAKMETAIEQDQCHYWLPLDQQRIHLNPLIGQPIKLSYQSQIHCQHCGRRTSKSYNQGFCFPCFKKLPQCDRCIVSPEKCHFDQGTCRDSDWGQQYCMTDHIVYLANSSGLKVGITRASQLPTRWIDQGAVQALPIFRVDSRYQSGMVEVLYKDLVADKTNWRAMLKGQVQSLDLEAERDRLLASSRQGVEALQQRFGVQAVQPLFDQAPLELSYPVLNHPNKVVSLSFDKSPEVAGVLQGIKGQYLILDTGVINIRKHSAYQVAFYA